VELTKLEHNAMLVGVFQLLQARQNEAEAQRDYIEAQRQYWSARTDLDRALNGIIAETSFTPQPISRPASASTSIEEATDGITRRKILFSSIAASVAGLVGRRRAEAQHAHHGASPSALAPPRRTNGRTSVITPTARRCPTAWPAG